MNFLDLRTKEDAPKGPGLKWAALDSRQRWQVIMAAGSYIMGISLMVYGLFFLESDQMASSLLSFVLGLLALMLWQDICAQFERDKLKKQILSLMEGGA